MHISFNLSKANKGSYSRRMKSHLKEAFCHILGKNFELLMHASEGTKDLLSLSFSRLAGSL
jgi:hypothetical protein